MRHALAPLVLTAVLAGCGSDDSGGLSKAEYLKRADQICAKFDKQLKAIKQPTNVEGIAEYAAEATPIARQGVDELRAVDAPEEIAADAKKLVDGLASDTELFEDLADAAAKKDTAKIEEIGAEAEKRTAERENQARGAGFKSCGVEDPS